MKKTLFTTFIVLFAFANLYLQETKAQASNNFMRSLAVGVEAGTFGGGLTLAAPLSANFKLRAGFDLFPFSYKEDIDIDADGFLPSDINRNSSDDINKYINMSGKLFDLDLSINHFKAIIDYYPFSNGIFSISAGFYLGKTSVSFKGLVHDYPNLISEYDDEHPVFEFGDIIVQPDPDGSFNGKIKFGDTFKPYFGIGLGRTIANSRVGFKFDLGLVYQGKIVASSPNVLSGDYNVNDGLKSLDLPVSERLLELWPVLNFSLSYRIF